MIYWFLIGYLVHVYYTYLKDDAALYKKVSRGEVPLKAFFIGLILTVILWPVTIYNQEFRQK